jgi:hypothetical protein
MKAEKQITIKIELEGDEVARFSDILFKILSVETTISPNVIRMLNDSQVKLLEEIQKAIL